MDNNDIGHLIHLISNKIRAKMNNEVLSHGITSKQSRVLGFLNDRKDIKTTQKDIQTHFEISHPTVAGLIKRLEEKELITTRYDDNDKRLKIIELAPKESVIRNKMCDVKSDLETLLLKGFKENEKETLIAGLLAVYNNINRG